MIDLGRLALRLRRSILDRNPPPLASDDYRIGWRESRERALEAVRDELTALHLASPREPQRGAPPMPDPFKAEPIVDPDALEAEAKRLEEEARWLDTAEALWLDEAEAVGDRLTAEFSRSCLTLAATLRAFRERIEADDGRKVAPATFDARERFLDMVADGEIVDESDDSGERYAIRTDGDHLRALAATFGIGLQISKAEADPEIGPQWETIPEAILRTIEEEAEAADAERHAKAEAEILVKIERIDPPGGAA